MAPRKRSRSVKVVNKDYSKLTLNDVLCPICRNILFEPVSLPCNHGFCLPCFEGTVANSNLTCPLCRIRFASWHRIATKENRIINECLWVAVKKLFPQLVQSRIDGLDNNIPEESSLKLATPGEIRKEYEEEKRRELLEIEKQRVAESKASQELINKIRQQEDLERTLTEVSLRKDEELARQLSEQLNPKISQLQLETPKKIKPLDKYLINMKKSEKRDVNLVANKKHITKILCQDKYPAFVIASKQNYDDKKHTKNGAINNVPKDIVLPSIYYFQPIEIIKTPSHISPIRIPVKQNRTNVIKIVAPKGTIALIPNVISAFARVSNSSPTIVECSPIRKTKEEPIKRAAAKKRKLFNENADDTKPVGSRQTTQKGGFSPSKVTCQRKSTRLLGLQPELESPPFAGFEPAVSKTSKAHSDCDVIVSSNNVVVAKEGAEKLEQERRDLEFAKKLQEEFNQMRWYSTRSSIPRTSNFCKKQRQIKLDEIIKCRSKVK